MFFGHCGQQGLHSETPKSLSLSCHWPGGCRPSYSMPRVGTGERGGRGEGDSGHWKEQRYGHIFHPGLDGVHAAPWPLTRSMRPEVRRTSPSKPWTLFPLSLGRWRARLSSGSRFSPRASGGELSGSRLRSGGYVVFATGLMGPVPTSVHTVFACHWSVCSSVCRLVLGEPPSGCTRDLSTGVVVGRDP